MFAEFFESLEHDQFAGRIAVEQFVGEQLEAQSLQQ